MATRTPKVAKSRTSSRGRAQHPSRPKPAHARPERAAGATPGPRAGPAFAAMMREYRERYPKSREQTIHD